VWLTTSTSRVDSLELFALQKRVDRDDVTTLAQVHEALQILKGAVMIVYPMGLPPHDPIREELENNEDLSGSQVRVAEADNGNGPGHPK